MSKKIVKSSKTKTVTKAVAGKPEVVGKTQTLHILTDTARPIGGVRLFAHTAAALSLFGMASASRPAVRRAAITTVMGGRAVSYHLSQKNMVVEGDGKVRLTAAGLKAISERKVDKTLVEKFVTLFRKGKVDSALGVKQANVAAANVAV